LDSHAVRLTLHPESIPDELTNYEEIQGSPSPTGYARCRLWSPAQPGSLLILRLQLPVASPISPSHQAAERLDAKASDPTVIPFPTPAYDPDADRFELTAQGEAYLGGAAEPPLA
jgi:hypothetical protein